MQMRKMKMDLKELRAALTARDQEVDKVMWRDVCGRAIDDSGLVTSAFSLVHDVAAAVSKQQSGGDGEERCEREVQGARGQGTLDAEQGAV
jgi:hypothetical protein